MNNLEDVLAHIGNLNRFQFIMYMFVKLPSAFVAWTMLEMSFVKAEPDWCCVPENKKATMKSYCYEGNGTFGDKCPDNGPNCTHLIFDNTMKTIVNEWDLVCDKKWKVNLSISVQMAGVLIGTLITGYLADFFGRKKTFYFSVSSLMAFSLIAGFSTCWEMFMVFRALLGLSCGINLVVNIPYIMEFISPSKREISSVVPIYGIGSVLMTLTAWLLHDWRWIHWICAAALFPLLSSWFFMPESLRWLTVKGKLDEAENVVAYISHINGSVVPDECREVLEMVYEQELAAKESGIKSYGYLDIYRGRDLFKLSVILQVIWFSFSFCGYGIAFGISTLDLNLYLNLLIFCASPIPVQLMMQLVMSRIGRRTIAVFLLSLTTLCGFASLAVYVKVSDENTRELITNILCLVATGFLGGSWSAIMVLSNESYPTVLRSLGYASVNTVSRVGGILAPFAFDFKTMPVVAYAMLGGFMALSTFGVFLLNETHGLDLADTLHEARIVNAVKKQYAREGDFLIRPDADRTRRRYGGVDNTAYCDDNIPNTPFSTS